MLVWSGHVLGRKRAERIAAAPLSPVRHVFVQERFNPIIVQ